MKRKKIPFFKRILFKVLLPVVIIGFAVSTLLVTYMSAPLETYLKRQFDSNLQLSSMLGLQACEESFSYLLDLRLEKNQEMNEVMQNEVIDKIKTISEQFPDINLMVVQSEKHVLASSLDHSPERWTGPQLALKDESALGFDYNGKMVKSYVQFFPFWDWHIVSFVFEEDYRTPVNMAYTITHMSAIGVFMGVLSTLLVAFYLFINRPLTRLIKATDDVAGGNLEKIDDLSDNEFGLLMASFNDMVEGLENEKTEVRNLISQLKESEAMFRSQFEYGNIGIAIVTTDEGWIRANERLCQMLGYEEEEVLAKPWSEFFEPQDLAEGMVSFNRMVADEIENYEHDPRVYHKNGQIVYTHLSISCIRNPDRSVRYVIASVADITERVMAERAQMETSRMLRLVLNTIPVRVFWKDLNCRYLGCNRSFSDDAGLTTPEELIGKTDHDLAFAAQAELFRKDDRFVMDTGESRIMYEEPQGRPDGSTSWVLTNKVPIRDENRKIIGVLGTYSDITDRKIAEEELRKLRNYLANIIDSMPSVLVGVNLDGIVTQWNMEAKRITGLSSREALGQSLDKVLPRFSDEMEQVYNAIKTRKKHTGLKRLQSEKDHVLYENITIYPLVTNGVDGAVIRIDDVTREQQLEEQLNHSRKLEAVGTLAGGIAHDFNNMLGGIMGATELLGFHLPDDPKAKKLHQTIIDAASRAAALTGKLLTFSRHNPKASTVVDVHEIIHETMVLLKNTIDRRITLDLDLAAELSTVVGDPSQLQNIFLNMGINGAHAMPDGGKLLIATQKLEIDEAYCETSTFAIQPGNYLEIEIRDTGCGIPLEYHTKIFDPFFTTKEQGLGTGLGLAAVYGSVQQHNGAIYVYSEEGSGTAFQILLPLTDVDKTIETTRQHSVKKGSGRILVVDDEEVMRITAQTILEDLGYEVVLAEDGQQAVTIFKKEKGAFDLVVLDMVMPLMNGRDCFLLLKKLDANVRVVLSSGFAREEDIEDMNLSGLKGLIRKPYRIAELSEIVHDNIS
ncbi:MAG: PAS domain S-box protein [Desulfopila sp.]|jgi:PAS domain S-box-containing protein|nr:PAS domain S-box protein [Desulfopila sp.]